MVSDRVSRRTFVGSLTVAGSIGLAGCGGFGGGGNGNGGGDTPTENDTGGTEVEETSPTDEETETPVDEADLQVRAVHAVVDGPDVDVYVDDELAFEGVTYADVTGYENIGAGDSQVRVTAAGDEDQVLFENELNVEDEGSYSVVAFGELDSQLAGSESTPDDQESMQNGTATEQDGTATPEGGSSDSLQVVSLDDEVVEGEDTQVRAFHASPDADPVDVTITDTEEPLVTDLRYGELSDYGAVEAGIQTIEVRAAGEDEVLADVDADFQEGRAHTAFAMGYAEAEDDSSEEALQIVAALDGTVDEGSGGESSAGTGNETGTGNESATDNETETSSA